MNRYESNVHVNKVLVVVVTTFWVFYTQLNRHLTADFGVWCVKRELSLNSHHQKVSPRFRTVTRQHGTMFCVVIFRRRFSWS
jgi:hypothetical protein